MFSAARSILGDSSHVNMITPNQETRSIASSSKRPSPSQPEAAPPIKRARQDMSGSLAATQSPTTALYHSSTFTHVSPSSSDIFFSGATHESFTPQTVPTFSAPETRPRKQRPTLASLSEEESRVAVLACSDFKAYMAAAKPYPTGVDLPIMAKDSWDRAHSRCNASGLTIPYSVALRKVVSHNICHHPSPDPLTLHRSFAVLPSIVVHYVIASTLVSR